MNVSTDSTPVSTHRRFATSSSDTDQETQELHRLTYLRSFVRFRSQQSGKRRLVTNRMEHSQAVRDGSDDIIEDDHSEGSEEEEECRVCRGPAEEE